MGSSCIKFDIFYIFLYNNSDFYKLKYLKYKNKYISLKNKNELELKGGLTSESGIFLFYIPETVLRANNIGFPLEETGKILSRLITKDGKITTLSFQNLYDMSVLVIPPAPDKVNISSTKEWYIPQPLKKSKLKWGEEKPIKYDRKTNKIEYDSTSRKRWLYYIAKEFLNTNSKEFLTRFNLADLDKQSMICLEYDVSHVIANKFISKTYIDSIEFFQHYLNKYYNEYKKNIALLQTAKETLVTVSEEQKTLQGKLKDITKLEQFLATNLEFVTANEDLFKTFLIK